jgi:osmotically-inducible protein OsmY
MRRARLLSGGFLLTMAISGLPGLAQAQSSYRPVVRPAMPATPIMSVSSTDTKTSEGPRSSVEMQIELAWLADPVTFPFDLRARARDGKLQVSGNVPNQAARDRVLLLAGQFAMVQVLDKLHIQSKLLSKTETVPTEELQRAVKDVLTREIGPTSGQLEIKAHASGQVSIAGDVATQEKKLAVSKSLQGIKGCVCVINLLNVTDPTPQPLMASKESKRTIQDRLSSLFSNSSDKKEAISEAKTASTWKQPQPAITPEAKVQTIATSNQTTLTTSNSPSLSKPARLTSSTIKTVSLEEKVDNAPESPLTPPKEMTEEIKKQKKIVEASKEASEPQILPSKATQPELSLEDVKQEVEKICGKSAHNVQVSIQPDKSVTISLECKNKSDAERLSKQILHLRKLAPFEVALDINFEP